MLMATGRKNIAFGVSDRERHRLLLSHLFLLNTQNIAKRFLISFNLYKIYINKNITDKITIEISLAITQINHDVIVAHPQPPSAVPTR